jgi:hypothetical protein
MSWSHHHHSHSDLGEEYVDEEQQYYPTESIMPMFSGASMTEGENLSHKDVSGVRKAIFDVSLPDGMTPEMLAENHRNGFLWQVPDAQKKNMRHILRAAGRAEAGDEDMAGDLNMGLILGCKVLSHYNNSSRKVGINLPGVIPHCYAGKGRYGWVIGPTGGTERTINKKIFEPDNPFTRTMYEMRQAYNSTSLKNSIRCDIDPNGVSASILNRGIGRTLLEHTLKQPQFVHHCDAVYEANAAALTDSNPNQLHWIHVPVELGKAALQAGEKPLEELRKAYQDFNKMSIRMVPIAGHWTDRSTQISASMAFNNESRGFEKDASLHTPLEVGASIQIKYVLDEE